MRTNKQRIRVEHAPLTVSSSLTHTEALTQVYNALDMQFNPDRTLTPLVLVPVVAAASQDGTVGVANGDGEPSPVNVNSQLAEMKWLVNGTDIRYLPDWTGLYEIDESSTDSRGSIAIKRNIPQGERVEIRFEAMLPDRRTGVNLKVAVRPVVLTCTDSADDEFRVTFEHGASVAYNPLRDNLALYEHEVANGMTAEDAAVRAQAADSECYLREIPVAVYRGGARMASGFSLKLLRNDGAGFSEVKAGEREVVGITADGVVLDLRLIGRSEYRVDAVVGGSVKALGQFSVWRREPVVDTEVVNTASIDPADLERRSVATVRHRTQVIRHPARLFDMVWLSDTSVKGRQEVRHNSGETGYVDLEQAGFNDVTSAGWIDIYVDVEQKGAHTVAADSAGTEFTDKDGKRFIFTTIENY